MEDILMMCKEVVKLGRFDDMYCIHDGCKTCPFSRFNNDSEVGCGADTDENYIKIAQEYIDEHEPKIERNDNMEKTFREAIADIDNIKKNEFYICKGDKNLKITKNGIDLEGLDWTNSKFIGFGSKFILQRKQYTFIEAFKDYEEGFEIEDMHGCKFKKIDGVDSYKMKCDDYFTGKSDDTDFWFGFEEIRGKWYINK